MGIKEVVEVLKRPGETRKVTLSIEQQKKLNSRSEEVKRILEIQETRKKLKQQAERYLSESAFPGLIDYIRKSGVGIRILKANFEAEKEYHLEPWPKDADIYAVGYKLEWDFRSVWVGARHPGEEWKRVAIECRPNGQIIVHGKNRDRLLLNEWRNNNSLQEASLERAVNNPSKAKRRIYPIVPIYNMR